MTTHKNAPTNANPARAAITMAEVLATVPSVFETAALSALDVAVHVINSNQSSALTEDQTASLYEYAAEAVVRATAAIEAVMALVSSQDLVEAAAAS